MDLDSKVLNPRAADDDDVRYESDSGSSSHEGGEDPPDGGVGLDRARARAAALEGAAAERRAAAARDPLGERRGGASTGPKGVLADKAWSDALEVRARDRARLQRAEAVRAGVGGGGAQGNGEAATEGALRRILSVGGPAAALEGQEEEKEEEEEEEEEEGNDFIAEYRAARLAEMRARASTSPGRPSYGSVVDLHDAFDLPPLIDSIHAPALLLLLLWEPYAPDCAPWVRAWSSLAPGHPHTLFVRIRASVASPTGYDPIGLPSVVAYRGGKEVRVVVRPQDACAEAGLLCEGAGTSGGAGAEARRLAQALRTGDTAAGRAVTAETAEAWLGSLGLL